MEVVQLPQDSAGIEIFQEIFQFVVRSEMSFISSKRRNEAEIENWRNESHQNSMKGDVNIFSLEDKPSELK